MKDKLVFVPFLADGFLAQDGGALFRDSVAGHLDLIKDSAFDERYGENSSAIKSGRRSLYLEWTWEVWIMKKLGSVYSSQSASDRLAARAQSEMLYPQAFNLLHMLEEQFFVHKRSV